MFRARARFVRKINARVHLSSCIVSKHTTLYQQCNLLVIRAAELASVLGNPRGSSAAYFICMTERRSHALLHMERLSSIASHVAGGRSLLPTSVSRASSADKCRQVSAEHPLLEQPPNILLLVTDQQTHKLLSCAGTDWLSTPHSDRLAAQGVRFTRAYATNPVCVPSRFSMFTGRMPSAIGLRHNQTEGGATFTSKEDEQSLGHLLQQAGYRTLYGGKTHWPIGLNTERLGFQTYFSPDERERLAVETAALLRNELAESSQPWFTVASLINPHDICYHAIRAYAELPGNEDARENRMVESAKNREIANLDEALLPPRDVSHEEFLRHHLPPPPANIAPQADEPEMIGELMDERLFRRHARENWTTQDWQLHRWAYARLMERVDKQIGVIIDALDASGQGEDTVVILTSDHGDHDGSHGLEHKTILYDEAVRVPFIMRHLGTIPGGDTRDNCLVSVGLDLMATCLDYARVSQPEHCLGFSLRSVAEATDVKATVPRKYVYCENQVSYCVANASWKYVLYDHGDGREQLYDHRSDPGETRNHATEHSDVLKTMRAALAEERAAHAAVAL